MTPRWFTVMLTLASTIGCDRAADTKPEPGSSPAPASAQPSNQAGSTVELAAEAATAWRLRELVHLPKYFQLAGWKDATTLFGRAGCNPVEVQIEAPDYVAWNLDACGEAVLAPDQVQLAWGDGRGVIRLGERGKLQRIIFDRAPSPGGEGDPTGLIIWSPDGERILTSWSAEWQSFYGVIDPRTGNITPLSTRLEGYFLTAAWDWLDQDRILFTLQAVRDLEGHSAYSEAGGYRTDLAVFDLSQDSYQKVTSVADSIHLRPLGKWNDTEILVGELPRGGQITAYWIYHTRTWSRRPAPFSAAGTSALVADSNQVLIVNQQNSPTRVVDTQLRLWQTNRVLPLAVVHNANTRMAWSPEKHRLAISTTVDEPVPGAAGSVVTKYVVYVIERRSMN